MNSDYLQGFNKFNDTNVSTEFFPNDMVREQIDTSGLILNILNLASIEDDIIYSEAILLTDDMFMDEPFNLSFYKNSVGIWMIAETFNYQMKKYFYYYDISSGENTNWRTHTEHDVIYETFDNVGVTQYMETKNIHFALFPNVTASGNSYIWNNHVKSWREDTIQTMKNVIMIDDNNNINIVTNQIIRPSNPSAIKENEVEYLTSNGKQLYFLSLADPSIGCTFINPQSANSMITDEELEMYKCRCLKSDTENGKTLLNINVSSTNDARNIDISYTSTTDDKYGYSIQEDLINRDVKFYNVYKNNDFEDVIVRVNDSIEEAQSEADKLPENTVAVIKPTV